MSIPVRVRKTLSDELGVQISASDDGRTLESYGVTPQSLGGLLDAVSHSFSPDWIRWLHEPAMKSVTKTVGQLIAACKFGLDINEVHRVKRTIQKMRDLPAPPPTTAKLSDLGITSATRPVLAAHLNDDFELYGCIDLSPHIGDGDVRLKMTVGELSKTVEERVWKT